MHLFSHTNDNNFRVGNKHVSVIFSLNINILSLLLNLNTDFSTYRKNESYVCMCAYANLCLVSKNDVYIFTDRRRIHSKKHVLLAHPNSLNLCQKRNKFYTL